LFKPAAYYPPEDDDSNDKSSPTRNEDVNDDDDEMILGMKLVSVRANNPSKNNLPSVPATTLLLNAETGIVAAVIASTYLTALRTAAGSAVATELCLSSSSLNDENEHRPLRLVVFGAGLQAECHIAALREVVAVKEVTIVNRSVERAEKLKERVLRYSRSDNDGKDDDNDDVGCGTHEVKYSKSLKDVNVVSLSDDESVRVAVTYADVIVTATNSSTPLFRGEWVSSGCHLVSVGSYTSLMAELDERIVNRCRVIVDTEEAWEVGFETFEGGSE